MTLPTDRNQLVEHIMPARVTLPGVAHLQRACCTIVEDFTVTPLKPTLFKRDIAKWKVSGLVVEAVGAGSPEGASGGR